MSEQEELTVVSPDDVENKAPPSDADLKNVRDHAAALWKAQKRLTALAEEAEGIANEISVLETKTIPDAMRKIGMRRFEMTGGFEVEVEDIVVGAITKAHKPEAHAFLEKNGWGSIIKRVITVEFGMNEEKWAAKFLRDLAARKRPVKFDRTDAVHSGTLKKFVKERIAAENAGTVPPSKKLPRDVFGVFEFVKASIVNPADRAKESAARGARKRAKKDEEVEM